MSFAHKISITRKKGTHEVTFSGSTKFPKKLIISYEDGKFKFEFKDNYTSYELPNELYEKLQHIAGKIVTAITSENKLFENEIKTKITTLSNSECQRTLHLTCNAKETPYCKQELDALFASFLNALKKIYSLREIDHEYLVEYFTKLGYEPPSATKLTTSQEIGNNLLATYEELLQMGEESSAAYSVLKASASLGNEQAARILTNFSHEKLRTVGTQTFFKREQGTQTDSEDLRTSVLGVANNN